MARTNLSRYIHPHYFSGTLSERGIEYIDDTREKHPFFKNVIWTFYRPRTNQRYMLVKDHFREYLEGAVLDVGNRKPTLSELLGKECTLVDKNNPALPVWDWEKEKLPYDDQRFDAIVCLDTLEHINDIHASVEDLMRVARQHIVISLPNPWRKTLHAFIRGRGDGAAYGIPPERPFDRHKWFFNPEDAENFLFYQCGKEGAAFRVEKVAYHIPQTILRHKIMYPILRFLLPERHFKNFFVETFFVCLTRR